MEGIGWSVVNYSLIQHWLCILLLAGLFVYFFNQIRVLLKNRLASYELKFSEQLKDYDNLFEEKKSLENESFILKNQLENSMNLYDITKEICKSLDENVVFNTFKEHTSRYLKFRDIQFLKADANLSLYSDYLILPLDIEKVVSGYLVADGIEDSDKDKFLILAHQFMLGIKRVMLYHKIQELAIMDFLTGIFSRRYFLERFNEELERSSRFKYSLACLMIDVDRFKEHNDHFGHLVGDAILKEVTKVIKEKIRQVDILGRYGGEEFCVVLTEAKIQEVRFAAERIRQAIADKVIKAYDEDLKVTISIGVAVYPDDAKDMPNLIDKADQALYQAKKGGRNKVCFYK